MRVVRRFVLALSAAALTLAAGAAFAQPVTIQVAVGAVGTELQLHRQALEGFMEENPDIRVELFETPSGGTDRLGLYLQFFDARSSEVDVLQIDVIWPGILEEHLVDLYDHGAADVTDAHFPGPVANNEVDGRLVAIPYQIGAGMLYYRTDLLDAYGYDGPPETWAELEEMARTIQAGERDDGNPDMWGYSWQGNAYEGLTCNALEWVASSGGGTIIDPSGTITIYNDAAIDAVAKAGDWVGDISPVGVTGYVEDDARNLFQSGNAVFMRNWPYAYGLGQAEDSVIRDRFEVTTLPSGTPGGPSASCLGGQSFAVSAYSDHPEEAARVALFLASFETQKLRAVDGSFSGTIAALYRDADVIEANPFFDGLEAIFAATTPRPSTVTGEDYTAVSRNFFNAVHSVLTGQEDAETALALLELELESLTGFPTGAP